MFFVYHFTEKIKQIYIKLRDSGEPNKKSCILALSSKYIKVMNWQAQTNMTEIKRVLHYKSRFPLKKTRIGSDRTFFILYCPHRRTKKVETTSTFYQGRREGGRGGGEEGEIWRTDINREKCRNKSQIPSQSATFSHFRTSNFNVILGKNAPGPPTQCSTKRYNLECHLAKFCPGPLNFSRRSWL